MSIWMTSSRCSEVTTFSASVDSATIRLLPSQKEVRTKPGDTVLAALEREGFAMANNCRAGACGECKHKLVDGEVDQGVVLDMALSEADRAEGYRLMCMAKPLSKELEIEFGTNDATPKLFPPRDRILCVITDLIDRTPKIKEVRLRPVGGTIRYWPGQYLMVGDERNGIPPRPYSIANAPRNDDEISLLVSHVSGGQTSTWIHKQLSIGDRLTVAGPYGTFIGDPGTDTPVLCLAAGSGLAPILALTDAALRRGFSKSVTVVYSARATDDLIDVGRMAWWTAKHRRFTFIPTYTREAPEGARFQGRIPSILDQVAPDLSEHSVYVAGSPEFVDDCVDAAERLGADQGRIFVERYHPNYESTPT